MVALLLFAGLVLVVFVIFCVILIRSADAPVRAERKQENMELRWERDVVKLLEKFRLDDDHLPFMTDEERAETQRLLDVFYRS